MCNGFGGIITQDGRLFFAEPDKRGDCSHSELLSRLEMRDNNNPFIRPFVRWQFPKWTEETFEWDEQDTLPGWVTEEHAEQVKAIFRRAQPLLDEYHKVCDPALDEYHKVCDPALAEYQKASAAAWAESEYQKVSDAAWAEYQKASAPAWAEYQKVCDPAWAEYQKVSAPAWAEFITALSKITGYIPAK